MQLPPGIDADAAAADAARHHLDAYAKVAFGITPAAHHREWCKRIQEVVEDPPLREGETRSRKRKLLLTAPPGHAKSTYTSLILPPWYLGRHPDHHVLFYTSIGTNASNFDGVVELALRANPRHAAVFPDEAARPNVKRGWSSEGRFLNGVPIIDKDPSYRAVGWGTSILGGRANGYVLDDVLSQEQSESETEQKAAKNKFEGTVDTRLIPGGWAIGIMTRWHELDLPSYLKGLPDWDHVNYPALVGGDTAYPLYAWNTPDPSGFGALWPDRFSAAWLMVKRLANPNLFEAYWQGDPSSLGGGIFTAGMFQQLPQGFATRPPGGGKSLLERLVRVQMWDLNHSERTAADFTVGLTLGYDPDTNKCYVLRVFRKQLANHEHKAAMVQEIMLARPALVGVWKGAYRTAYVASLVREVQKALIGRAGVSVMGLDEDRDKVTRARLPASFAAQGDLYAYKEAPWWPEFVNECVGFPKRAHDDQVDALSGAVQLAIEYGGLAAMPAASSYSFGTSSPESKPGLMPGLRAA